MRKLLIAASLFHPINIKRNKFRGNSLQQGPILYPWCSIFRPFILNVRYVKSSHIESLFYFRFTESDAIDASLSISSTFCRGLLAHSIESLYPSSNDFKSLPSLPLKTTFGYASYKSREYA